MGVATTDPFDPFGPAHLAVLALTAASGIGLGLWLRRAGPGRLRRAIGWSLAAALVANELLYAGQGLASHGPAGFARAYLPVHICGLAAYLTAWLLVRPRQGLFEVTYFWALAGTAQATLTPELQSAFPSYGFCQYFVRHSGIVVGVLIVTVGYRMRPRRWAPLRVFGLTAGYAALVAGVNAWTGGNYMFLRHRPDVSSPFFFLPWPWYIPFLAVVGLAMFCLLQAPFWIADRPRRRASPPA